MSQKQGWVATCPVCGRTIGLRYNRFVAMWSLTRHNGSASEGTRCPGSSRSTDNPRRKS